MNKKQTKKLEIKEVIINALRSSSDVTGEWTTNADIDFFLNEPFSFQIFHDSYAIDRVKLICGYDGVSLFYANESQLFTSLSVSKVFVHKIYDTLLVVQKEERFKKYSFEDDLMDMLQGAREITAY